MKISLCFTHPQAILGVYDFLLSDKSNRSYIKKRRKSYTPRMPRGWVKQRLIFIFGWTNPLKIWTANYINCIALNSYCTISNLCICIYFYFSWEMLRETKVVLKWEVHYMHDTHMVSSFASKISTRSRYHAAFACLLSWRILSFFKDPRSIPVIVNTSSWKWSAAVRYILYTVWMCGCFLPLTCPRSNLFRWFDLRSFLSPVSPISP